MGGRQGPGGVSHLLRTHLGERRCLLAAPPSRGKVVPWHRRRGLSRAPPAAARRLCKAEQTAAASPSAGSATGTTRRGEATPCFLSPRLGISPLRGVASCRAAGAEPGAACCRGVEDFCGVRGAGSSPGTARCSGCCDWRFGLLTPSPNPGPAAVPQQGSPARPQLVFPLLHNRVQE